MEEINNQKEKEPISSQNEFLNDNNKKLINKVEKIVKRMFERKVFEFKEEKQTDYLKNEFVLTLGDIITFGKSVTLDLYDLKAKNKLIRVISDKNYLISYFVGALIKFFDEEDNEDFDRFIDICSYLANLKELKICVTNNGGENYEEY